MKVLIFLAVLVLATAFEYAAEWEAWKSVSCSYVMCY